MLSKFDTTDSGRLLRWAVTLLLVSLVGCGGESGGSTSSSVGSNPLPQPPGTPIAINVTNATQVSAIALEPGLGGTDLLNTVTGVETSTPSTPRALTRTLLRVTRDATERRTAPQSVVGIAQTSQCAVSGSVTEDSSLDGSSGATTYNACSEVPGETLNGSSSFSGLTFTFDEVSGDFGMSGNFSMDLTYTEAGSAPLRMVGSFSMNFSCSFTTGNCQSTFFGSSLGASDGTNTWFITNFTITEASDPTDITITVNYTVSSTELNGAVTVLTSPSAPLKMAHTALHPHTGTVIITGAANSKIRVTVHGSDAIAANQVQIEVDADGDGSYESSTFYSWTQLEGL